MIQITPTSLSSMAFLALQPQRGTDGAGVVEKESGIQSGGVEKLSKANSGPRLESKNAPTARQAARLAQDSLNQKPAVESSTDSQTKIQDSETDGIVAIQLPGATENITIAAEMASQVTVLPQQVWNPIEDAAPVAEVTDAVVPTHLVDAEELEMKLKLNMGVHVPSSQTAAQDSVGQADSKQVAGAETSTGEATRPAPVALPTEDLMDWKTEVQSLLEDRMDWSADSVDGHGAVPAMSFAPSETADGMATVDLADEETIKAMWNQSAPSGFTDPMPAQPTALPTVDLATEKEFAQMAAATQLDLATPEEFAAMVQATVSDEMAWDADIAVETFTENQPSDLAGKTVKAPSQGLSETSDLSPGLKRSTLADIEAKELQTKLETNAVVPEDGVDQAGAVQVKLADRFQSSERAAASDAGLAIGSSESTSLESASSSDLGQGNSENFSPNARQDMALRADRLGGNQPIERTLTQRETSAVLKQVSDRIELLIAARPKNGVTVHLDPGDLGKVTIIVKNSGKDVEAQIITSNENVRQAIAQSKNQLVDQLDQRGFSLASVTVSQDAVSQQPNQGQAQAQSQAANRNSGLNQGRPDVDSTSRLSVEQIRAFTQKSTGVDYWI